MSLLEHIFKKKHFYYVIKSINELNEELRKVRNTLKADKQETFTIRELVETIVDAHKRCDHVSIIIQGLRGTGKTTLLLHILSILYGKGYPNYMRAVDYTYFSPLEALDFMKRELEKGKSIVCLGFDDAGTWISKWVQSRDKTAFLEFSNLFREILGGAIYTDVMSLHKYIRDTANIRIQLRKLTGPERKFYYGLVKRLNPELAPMFNGNVEWSVARIYDAKIDVFGNQWLKRKAIMLFPLLLPKRAREYYKQKRRRYSLILLERTYEKLSLRLELEDLRREIEKEKVRLLRIQKYRMKEEKKLLREMENG